MIHGHVAEERRTCGKALQPARNIGHVRNRRDQNRERRRNANQKGASPAPARPCSIGPHAEDRIDENIEPRADHPEDGNLGVRRAFLVLQVLAELVHVLQQHECEIVPAEREEKLEELRLGVDQRSAAEEMFPGRRFGKGGGRSAHGRRASGEGMNPELETRFRPNLHKKQDRVSSLFVDQLEIKTILLRATMKLNACISQKISAAKSPCPQRRRF